MSRWQVLLVFSIALAMAYGSPQSSTADSRDCDGPFGVDWDVQITSCTDKILSGRFQDRDLAKFFYNRGNAYNGKGDKNSAIEDYNKATELDPKFAYAFNNRGSVHGEQGRYDLAIQDFERAVSLDPSYAEAADNLKIALELKRQEIPAGGPSDLTINLNPSNMTPLKNRTNGDGATSPERLGKALTKFLESSALTQRGITLNAQFDRLEAIQLFDKAIQLDPKNAVAFFNRGDARSYRTPRSLAIEDFDQAIALNPDLAKQTDIFFKRGRAYFWDNQFDLAIQDFDRAIIREPKNAENFDYRGDAYQRKGQVERAIQDYEQAVKLDPKHREASYNLCGLKMFAGRPAEAIGDCDRAARLYPSNEFSLALKALAYFKIGQFEKSIAEYNNVLKSDHYAIALALYGRGLAKLKLGDATGNADISAAKAKNPRILEESGPYGVKWPVRD